MGIGSGLFSCCRGSLRFSQSIYIVIQHQDSNVHVVTQSMNPVAGPNSAVIPVTRNHKYLQVRPAALDPTGHGKRPAVQAVEAVGFHIMGEPA